MTVVKLLKKYFWEVSGQQKHEDHKSEIPADSPWDVRFLHKYRRLVGFLIPGIIVWVGWFCLAFQHNYWPLFKIRWQMSVTMIFGALIAGMTSEGGGAVAFPVMTLILKLNPKTARDFALMIQSFGMSAASFTIIFMHIQLEWRAIIFCSLGAFFGLVLGLEKIDPLLSPPQKKLGFVSVWFSFAMALFLLNCKRHRKTFSTIPNFSAWKMVILFMGGILGGCFTAIAGSGVDICCFSLLTLLFHISEKVATPTSVVLMSINTVIGFFWRELMQQQVEQLAWEYLAVCVPIVIVCAPFGSLLASHFHRLVLASFVYVLQMVALLTGFIIIRPGLELGLTCGGVILAGFLFFFLISRLGMKIAQSSEDLAVDESVDLGDSEPTDNSGRRSEKLDGNKSAEQQKELKVAVVGLSREKCETHNNDNIKTIKVSVL